MKVKELIKILHRFDQEADIFTFDGDTLCDIDEEWIYDKTVYQYECLAKDAIKTYFSFKKLENPHIETILPKAVILDI